MSEKAIKRCKTCNKELPLNKFEEIRTGVFRRECRVCRSWGRSMQLSTTPKAYLEGTYHNLKGMRIKQGIEFTLSLQDVLDLWEKQGGRCALSGVLLTYNQGGHYNGNKRGDFNASIDRINTKGPYVKTNVQLVAWRVNSMKNDLSEEMFLWWIRNLHNQLVEKTTGVPPDPAE